ncbi:MAG TPA: hypothetical protein VFQ53_09505 [Kofleriaceae bacterium]|nr:hypothetical protein [Kofleriaceae bacterium]
MKALVVVLALVAGCSKQEDAPKKQTKPPAIPAVELQRGTDACNDYVKRACACAETVPAAKEACALGKALPEAIDIAKRLATNPDADDEDSHQAADSIRKTVKNCIEQTAKLPALGCP